MEAQGARERPGRTGDSAGNPDARERHGVTVCAALVDSDASGEKVVRAENAGGESAAGFDTGSGV